MADIGDKLRSAREAKGLSIEDIEKATKIQSRYLTAIEQNDFDKLPGDFYVRAFIRQYAQIVGLDGKELLSEYHQDVPESKPDEYVENSIDNKSEEIRETTDNKKNLWKNYLPRIAVGVGIVVVLLVIYALYAHLSAGNQNNNTSSNVSVSSQSSSTKAKPKTKTTTSAVKISKVGNDTYRITGLKTDRKLELKAGNQAISASVSINGVMHWQQTLAANQKHTLSLPTNATNVVITFGNDNGTSVKIAGKRIPYVPAGKYLSLNLLIGNKKPAATKKASVNNNSTANSNNTGNTTTYNTQRSTQQSETRQPQSSRPQTSTPTKQSQSQSQVQSSSTPTQQSSSTATTTSSTAQNNTKN